MAYPGRHGEDPLQDTSEEKPSDDGENSPAGASDPLERAAMNKCSVNAPAEELQPLTVPEQEAADLAKKAKAAMAPVREDRVNDLRARIKDGSYDPSSEAIAAKILEHRLNERRVGG